MGNVQCCASGRFPEGKPQNKPKEKKKKKTKSLKGVTKKTSSAGAGKGNGSVQKVVAMAEDASERAAQCEPQSEVLAQAAPPTDTVTAHDDAQEHSTLQGEAGIEDIDAAARNESIAVARERFFNQVGWYTNTQHLPLSVTIATRQTTTSGAPRDELIPLS